MKKKSKKAELKHVHIKLTEKELKDLMEKANNFAGGNLSLWLRHAGLNHVPKKEEFTSVG
jgi:hypothetical protein